MSESAFLIAARALAVLARQGDQALPHPPARVVLVARDAGDRGLDQADTQADLGLRHAGIGEGGDGF